MRITGTLDIDGSTIKLDQGGNSTTITENSPGSDITLTLPKDADGLLVNCEHGGDATKEVTFDSSGATTAKELTISSSHTDDRTLTLPDATDTIVARDTTDTLTNKTLTSPTINTPTLTVNDDSLTIQDNGDTTKKLKFQLSGITTSTTRTLTIPDADDTIVTLAETQTLTNKTLTTPSITVNDNAWTMQDNSDTSKKLNLQLSGITTSTTRTLTIPDADTTIVGTDATQTLTNKTLTSPVLTTPTFSAGSNITLTQQSELRLEDSTGGEYVGLVAEATVNASYTLSTPPDAPTANSQVLCVTDYTASPITTQWAAALSSTLSDQHLFIGNSSNASTAVDTQLAGDIEAKVLSFTFVDGDVNTGTDRITETSHNMVTGDRVYLTSTGTLPAGLSASTEYFVIKVDNNTFELATTLANAIAGTQIDITAAAGGGTHTLVGSGLDIKASSLIDTPTLSVPVIADSSDLTKDLTFTLSGATAASTMTLSSSHTTDRTLTLPDATDTLVGLATTDTLTNKTLTAPTVSGVKQFGLDTVAKSGDYTVTDSDGVSVILMTTSTTDRTVTLPTATDNTGRVLTITKVDSGSGITIIDGEGSETIDGSTTLDLSDQYDSITIFCDGSAWFVQNSNFTTISRIVVDTANGAGSAATNVNRRLTNVTTNVGADISYNDSSVNGAEFTINADGIYTFDLIYALSAAGKIGLTLNVKGTNDTNGSGSDEIANEIQSVSLSKRLGMIQTQAANNPSSLSVTRFFSKNDVIRIASSSTTDGATPAQSQISAIQLKKFV